MKEGLVRHLDQIQEEERSSHGLALGKLVLVSLGGACLVFAAISVSRREAVATTPRPDPLSVLVAKAESPARKPLELAGGDVTFPGMLSDQSRPTTALAAMRDGKGDRGFAASSLGSPQSAALGGALATPAPVRALPPPQPADRLPVVPLPAKNVVAASPIVTHPRDALTQMAREASVPTAAPVEEGKSGYYQLQASSFRTEEEATSFATALRQRGHRAYVESATIPGRGTWFRVRIGPFKTQHEAALYRADFERREHLAPFLVEPPREKAPGAPSMPATIVRRIPAAASASSDDDSSSSSSDDADDDARPARKKHASQ
jgi:DedD protein